MELHYGKLQLLTVQCNFQLPLPNGHDLIATSGMTYLGTNLSSDGRLGTELGRRIGFAKREFQSLCKLWGHSNLPWKRKFQIYCSLIESKLLYGLATCCLTIAEQRRLNGFQARCLRQVLRIKPAFYSRISNQTVLNRANHTTAVELLTRQQLAMFGRVLRSSHISPLHTCAVVLEHYSQPLHSILGAVAVLAKNGSPQFCKVRINEIAADTIYYHLLRTKRHGDIACRDNHKRLWVFIRGSDMGIDLFDARGSASRNPNPSAVISGPSFC